MNKFKIKNIELDGDYDTSRIMHFEEYLNKKTTFRIDKGLLLPLWYDLQRIDKRDALWLLLNDLTVTVTLENDTYLQFKFKAGFIWDQASVPFFKNNDKQEIIAAMVHDALFSLHLLYPDNNNKGFRAANRLFKSMVYYAIDKIVKEEGYSSFKRAMMRIKSRWHYRAVMSIFGRARYETDSPRRAFWHKKTVQFDCTRRGEWM